MNRLFLYLIPIYKKINIDIKANIYYICFRVMTKHEQNFSNLAINARKTLCYLSKANKIVLKL